MHFQTWMQLLDFNPNETQLFVWQRNLKKRDSNQTCGC